MSGVVPLGTAVCLLNNMPLVVPASPDAAVIDGAYDVNVPTLLLTDVLAECHDLRHVVVLGQQTLPGGGALSSAE